MKLIVQYSVSLVWILSLTYVLSTSAIVVGAANAPPTRIDIKPILKSLIRMIFIQLFVDLIRIFIIIKYWNLHQTVKIYILRFYLR
jgi:hypothetical protein